MRKIFTVKLLMILAISFFSLASYAQDGNVTGTVSDAK